MLKPKDLQEVVYKYSDDIIQKIIDGGWEYYETMGNLPGKAAKVARQAREEKKKLFTLAYERDSSSDPVIQYINVFWSDKGSGTNRDVIEGGTMQDYEDIRDAGQLNLNEVDTTDLAKFEEVIEKIVDEGVNFYAMLSPRFHGSKVIEFLKGEEARVNQPQFAIQKFKNGIIVIFSDGTRFNLLDATEQDLQDIKDAGDLNKINEVVNKDLARFDQVIEKIIDIGASNYSFPSKITRRYTADRITDVLKDIEEIEGSPIFTIDKYANGIIVHFSDGTRYPLDADEQDIKDILDASNINKIEEVATVDLNKWEEVLDMIVDQGYEYFAAENLPIHDTPMPAPKTALYLNASKKKKKLFTVIKNISVGGPLGDKERQTSLEIYLAKPDTPEVKRFYIHNTTDEDVEDLLGAADLNVESIKEAKNLARFEELLNKVAEGDYYYVPSMATDMDRMAMQQKRVERSYDLDKPLFSYIWDGKEIAAVFSDEPENFFWIFNATKEDKQDLVDAVKTFMSKIPLDKMKKTLEESVQDSVHELGHYKDITTFMNDNGLKLEPFPTLKFIDDDEENAEDLFGKTAYYDPKKK